MIKVIWNVIKKIFGILLTILSPLKRLLCRRKRRTSDTILPMSNHYSIPQDFNQMPANTEEEFQAWDDWDSESKKLSSNGQPGNSRTKKDSQTEEDDIDFFSDMTPRIKKQKKVYIGGNTSSSQSNANKFAFSADVPVNHGSELGSWEDTENAWGEESLEDLSWQADEAIKQSRKSEHQRRLQEHARRKMEKEQARSKKDSSFAAVRLSS